MKRFAIVFILLFSAALSAAAQTEQNFSFAAQKSFIPKDLGKVYLGMPFNQFAKQFDLKDAEVGDTRFDWLELTVPVKGESVESLTVRIHGLSQDEKKAVLKTETVMKKDRDGFEYENDSVKLLIDKIPPKGFIYAMYVVFKKDFDQKSFVVKTYGKDGEVRKAGDEYHFFDIQWTKKTSDGLNWLIRSFHEEDRRSLQLLGRIDGTEWEN